MSALPAPPLPGPALERTAPLRHSRAVSPVRLMPVRDEDLTPSEVRTRHAESLSAAATDDHERFDRITTLACSLFAVPMATVTLIDGDGTRWAGSTGFSGGRVETATAAFSALAVKHVAPLIVEDATADARFVDLPAVSGAPYLRFYAGIQLTDDDGVSIGTFSLFDTVPRRLDRTQVSMLSQLASWVCRELIDSSEMARAREVQAALLPARTELPDGLRLASICRPTKGVGGDFFDFAMVRGRLFLTLVDVMGKGVGAGLLAASVRAILRASVAHQVEIGRLTRGGHESVLADVIRSTDRLLRDDLGQTGSLVTGFATTIDPDSGEVTWVDAGHGLALIAHIDGSTERLAGDDLPVGIGLDSTWTEHTTALEPGDTLLVVSDGLFDLLGGTSDAIDRIGYLVRTDPEPDELIARIAELTMLGTALDDVTAVAVRRSSGVPR